MTASQPADARSVQSVRTASRPPPVDGSTNTATGTRRPIRAPAGGTVIAPRTNATADATTASRRLR